MTMTNKHTEAMVDAAMVEMQNIHPPLRRSDCARLISAALALPLPVQEPPRKFSLNDRVRKHSGAWWEGCVVGFYSTKQTPIGYNVQMDAVENGPVQIYPESALELASPLSPSPSIPEEKAKTGELSELWKILEVDNQTAAVVRLRQLTLRDNGGRLK